MSNQKTRILFIHQKLEPYVLKDLNILREEHDVRECEFIGVTKTNPLRLIRDTILLFRGVLWADVTFSWFGKLHAFLGVLFSKGLGKKSVVVAGGDDVAKHRVGNKPYGLCAHPIHRWFAYFTFKWADSVLSVSQFNLQETLRNARVDPAKTKMIYHGFDGQVFQKESGVTKEPAVVTIGNVDYENYYRKGLKLFLEAARHAPDVPFFLVGARFGPKGDDTMDRLQVVAPDNLRFTGRLSKQELTSLLSRAMVYVQASEHEAFGCSLAEAMLCECVPVVSRTTALPEVAGDCGVYLDEPSPAELAAKIRQALQQPEAGVRARRRVLEHFPLSRRREELLKSVDAVLAGANGRSHAAE